MAVVNAIPKHIRNRVFSNIGRNEHCPCGSGKKYKNCCESGYINYEIIGIEKITPVYFSF
ncbi:MAG: SEC-C domain-containing protein [Clostridiales bacterium]|nr:SEC-C domain-containing protein [Clostridiales bacterium]